MIITSDFVLLNFPKTGSSFIREAIKRVYPPSSSVLVRFAEKAGLLSPAYTELFLPKIDEARYLGIKDQHGTWRQIPEGHREKKVVSISRNPLSRYLSAYHFGWWKKYPPADRQELQKRYPHFPNISFREYYEMIQDYSCKDRLKGISPAIRLGLHSIQFIQFYSREPEVVLKKIDQRYIEEGGFLNDIAEVKFLEQENLNSDLKEFLLSLGKEGQSLAFLDSMEKINVTERGNSCSGYAEKEIDDVISSILVDDRLIFRLFPAYQPSC